MTKFKVSQSKVKTFRRCKRAYQYRYIDNLVPKRKRRPLMFGTMIHKMVEYFLNGDEPQDYLEEVRGNVELMRLFKQERDEYGDLIQDVSDIMTDYFEFWANDQLVYLRSKRRAAEHTFEIELFPDVVWNGKIDARARSRDGLRWLVEHKTYNRRPDDNDRWRDLQSVTYFRANDILGWAPLDGCMWDYIKSKPPQVPGILKDGTLSVKRIDTLPSTINRVLDSQHVVYSDGQANTLIEMAKANRKEYFHRVHTPVNRAVADMVFSDFKTSIQDMVSAEGKKTSCWPRSIDKHCSWCDYESLCRAALQGLDTDFVKEREYETRKKEDNPEEYDPIHRVELSPGS